VEILSKFIFRFVEGAGLRVVISSVRSGSPTVFAIRGSDVRSLRRSGRRQAKNGHRCAEVRFRGQSGPQFRRPTGTPIISRISIIGPRSGNYRRTNRSIEFPNNLNQKATVTTLKLAAANIIVGAVPFYPNWELFMLPVSADVLSLFLLSSCALALAPGPDNIFVLTQSAMNGRIAGFLVTFGLCTGLLFHTAAVAVGVAAVFAASAVAFTVLKVVGAGYLVYLAWFAFRSTGSVDADSVSVSGTNLYFRGVIMNITNPKVAIFFLAFLPQFADPSRGSVTWQIIIFGAIFVVVTLAVFGSVAWFSGFVGEKLRGSPKVRSAINKVAGVVFLGLAARLLVTER